ncbi:hypothetical protein HYC85_029984 [Camellia sinensis]|uniref:Phorbol-ester/DAG-type domain-containing protein n=1 Tax=Camellia sinensis TaxID=4442 RepID=A0A7J7FZF0_CAMSI|nr:hypothetical protein HYC85_029984 [Camellia sinensis]
MCSTCDFWIHEDCALLPTTFKYRGHVHPLTLCYSLLYGASCRICQEGFRTYQWSYQCRGCQYHAHANFSTKTKESETVTEVEELDMTNLFRLPMPDESVNLFNQFLEQLNVPTVNLIDQFVEQLDLEHASNKIKAKLYNSIHSHPLILFDVDSEDNLCSMSKLSIHNDEQKNEKICDACVQSISVPFYSCSHSQCNFFMYKRCVKLPIEIQHPCHPHPLSLDNRSSCFGWFTCSGCGKQCNRFTFQCTIDKCIFNETFCLDVKCASLPSYIVHEFHEHPLRLRPNCTIEGCVACDRCNSTFSYGCGICNFHLHSNCALLPRTIKHRYDEHPFSLIYAPIKDGPDEYICEFCEEDIDPKWWFYHCIDCDQSACAKCIYKEEKEYSNIKLGITKKFNSHPHPLDLVQVVNKSSICDKCEQNFFGGENVIAYMCVQCNTKLHEDCILLREMFCNT